MAARTIRLADVWKALDHCCPGNQRTTSDHYCGVSWKGKTYPRMPLGKHGQRKNPEIEAGHVRQMIRFFGVTTCFWGQIPEVFGNKKPSDA